MQFVSHFNKQDKKADLVISTYVDDILEKVAKRLGIEIPEYTTDHDPTKQKICELEWTISSDEIKNVEKLFNEKQKNAKKRKSNKDDEDDDDKKKEKKAAVKSEEASDQ